MAASSRAGAAEAFWLDVEGADIDLDEEFCPQPRPVQDEVAAADLDALFNLMPATLGRLDARCGDQRRGQGCARTLGEVIMCLLRGWILPVMVLSAMPNGTLDHRGTRPSASFNSTR